MAAEPYRILFRAEIEDDLRPIPGNLRARILDGISKRLAEHPDLYGKPLGGTLSGLRRIRTGDYRIVYQVKGYSVIIWAVRHRKDVYREMETRLRSH
ncbi:MAG: type II toxin-antitoxin system RelE/ParE family toxin [Elusimicrobia bacterium]|nr:type II toxin-antitoxin system RelE/ParE family toxin [Elusimicrobiota bacterium]